MKRTPQEIVELVVFGLIALLVGTGVLWLLGAVFGLLGTVLGWLAALLWGLLSFLVPVALVAAAVVLIVRWAQGKSLPGLSGPAPARAASAPARSASAADARPEAAADGAVDRDRAAEATAEGMPPAPAGTPPLDPGSPTDGTEPTLDASEEAPDEARRDDG